MNLAFPTSKEFLAMCENENSSSFLKKDTRDLGEKIAQELKMIQIDSDMKAVELKIYRMILDGNSLHRRRIRLFMNDLSKHKECHVWIMDIINKLADDNEYKAVYYDIEYPGYGGHGIITYAVCCLIPISEYTDNYEKY